MQEQLATECEALPQQDGCTIEERIARLRIQVQQQEEIPNLIDTNGEVLVLERDRGFVIYTEEEFKSRCQMKENDTTNFFKARLTSGSCWTLPWLDDFEELKGGNPDLDTSTLPTDESSALPLPTGTFFDVMTDFVGTNKIAYEEALAKARVLIEAKVISEEDSASDIARVLQAHLDTVYQDLPKRPASENGMPANRPGSDFVMYMACNDSPTQ